MKGGHFTQLCVAGEVQMLLQRDTMYQTKQRVVGYRHYNLLNISHIQAVIAELTNKPITI